MVVVGERSGGLSSIFYVRNVASVLRLRGSGYYAGDSSGSRNARSYSGRKEILSYAPFGFIEGP